MNETLSQSRGPGRPSNAERAAQQSAQSAMQSTAPTPSATAPQRRPERKPFGSSAQKLAYPDREGYHRHWFNEEPGRIDQAREAGYSHVEKDGEPVKRVVGTARDGGALVAWLMEIPEEWYRDDMRAEQTRVDENDMAIRRGKVEGKNAADGDDRFYDTAQGRKITIARGR